MSLIFSCAPIEEGAGNVGCDAGDVEISLYGGRERLVCVWDGVSQDDRSIRLSIPGRRVITVPVIEENGESVISGFSEGEYAVGIELVRGEGTVDMGLKHINILGDTYEKGLAPLQLKDYVRIGHVFKGEFDPKASSGLIGEEILYTDREGNTRTEFIPLERMQQDPGFHIDGTDLGTVMRRTVYMPVPEAHDRYHTPYIKVPEKGYTPEESQVCATVDGYRGIWFALGQVNTEYGDKYSGGLGTYTMKHIPMAVYSPEADKTFFVYGGTPSESQKYLQCMIGCYDHATGFLQKPRVVQDKGKDGVKDPHDDPTVQIDRDGHIWVFVSGRSTKREGYRYRSVNPYDITAFETVDHTVMAYPQVMYSRDKGFFLFYTRYDGTRQLFYSKSRDGREWTPYRQLASIKEGKETKSGHYQISNICGEKLCTAFNRHINGNVDTRTSIYFLQSEDWGETWTTASGEAVKTPVTERYSNSLVIDYQAEGKNCYIKDLNFDTQGNPVILYLISDSHLTGPEGGAREWFSLYWNGTEWEKSKITESTHCYDSGSIWVDGDTWTVLAPTDAGPQYWGAGGEVVQWTSTDKGRTWTRTFALTAGSASNHTYVRRPLNASDGFLAFWADGNADTFSRSSLYFCNRDDEVFRMPYDMTAEWQSPERYN